MELFSESLIDQAYHWLCQKRAHYPPNADIWSFRSYWQAEKQHLLKALRQGDYCFEPLTAITTADGSVHHLWSARDALVLKCLSLILPGSRGAAL